MSSSPCPKCKTPTWDEPNHICPPEWIVLLDYGDKKPSISPTAGIQKSIYAYDAETAIRAAMQAHYAWADLHAQAVEDTATVVWIRENRSKTWIKYVTSVRLSVQIDVTVNLDG